MGKIKDFFSKCDVKLDKKTRIIFFFLLVVLLLSILLPQFFGSNKNNNEKVDTNVYLNEEICYAGEVYFTVDSINVTKIESGNDIDEDGDFLSNYQLNLGMKIEQRNVDGHINKVKVSPSCFELKSVNLKAKSKMSVFFECLARETLSIIAGGAIGGSINIIEETVNYAADYTMSSIENATNSKVKFKPIKCIPNSFESFYPSQVEGSSHINLHFPIKQEYLDSDYVIVLAIDDSIVHLEKRIFLIVRPN